MATLFSASWVVPVNTPPIRDGAVLERDGFIVAVGPRDALDVPPATERMELDGTAILPGFVDAHAHLELASFLASPQFEDLFALMRYVGDARARATPRELAASREAACHRCLAHGVTTVVDWCGAPDRRLLGPRILCALEVIAPEGAKEVDLSHADVLAPHSLYMTSGDAWSELLGLAAATGLPVTTHLAETPEEVEWIRSGEGRLAEHCRSRSAIADIPRGLVRPTDLLLARGHLGPALIAVHGTALDSRDLEVIAAKGASLCLCPRSNLQTTGRLPDLERILELGIRFVLGTDSFAGDQDLLADARELFRLCPRDADAILAAMTTSAGSLLRPAGTLRAGAPCDLALVRVPDARDMAASILAEGESVGAVVGGKLAC
jgi:cytosine/adenosine deaminase-related metal-dependent hydrolase